MNKVMLIGNVGKDPDVKYYDADQAVAQFSLATTERGYQLPNGTRVPDRTDWHNIVMWGNLATTTTRRDSAASLLRCMPTTWNCLRRAQQLTLRLILQVKTQTP